MRAVVEAVTASELKPSDFVVFSGSTYKAKSVIVKHDRVEIVWWHTNDNQPYFYEPQETLAKVVP